MQYKSVIKNILTDLSVILEKEYTNTTLVQYDNGLFRKSTAVNDMLTELAVSLSNNTVTLPIDDTLRVGIEKLLDLSNLYTDIDSAKLKRKLNELYNHNLKYIDADVFISYKTCSYFLEYFIKDLYTIIDNLM